MRPILDEFADLHGHTFAGFDDRRLDGVLERELVGAAVTLQHDPVEPDEARTVVAARIESPAQCFERGLERRDPECRATKLR